MDKMYEKNQEYGEAKEILLLAMESASNARHIVFRLTELAIRTGNMEEADAFCAEFEDLAHDDPRKYLLQYKILSAKGAAPEQKIIPLERYTATEIDEQWMYELAEQYLEAGQTAKCVAMCDRIMLFFGTGEYVQKAAELKADGAGAALSAYKECRTVFTARHALNPISVISGRSEPLPWPSCRSGCGGS